MRILLATVDHEVENVQRARRLIGYDRLVLVAAPADEEAARGVMASEEGVVVVDAYRPQLERVSEAGFEDTLDALDRLGERLKGHTLTVALCGGSHTLQMAALVYAYNHGMALVVSNAGAIERLPVLRGFSIVERLSADERAALEALAEPTTTKAFQAALGWDARRFGKVIGRMRSLGLLRAVSGADGEIHVARSAAGDYYAGP